MRTLMVMGWDSSVGIATCYGLGGPWIKSGGGGGGGGGGGRGGGGGGGGCVGSEVLPHLSRRILGPTQPLVQWVRVIPKGKVAGAWR